MFFVFFMFSWFFYKVFSLIILQEKYASPFQNVLDIPFPLSFTINSSYHYFTIYIKLHFLKIPNDESKQNSSLSFWLNPVTNYFWWKYIYIQFKFKLSLFWSDASLISRKKPMISRIKRTKAVARVVRLRVYFWLLARKLLIIFS